MEMKRQGDILFIREDNHPELVKDITNMVVAYGEVTGHHHKVVGDEAIVGLDKNNVMWIVTPHGAEVIHEEHNTVPLEEGTWRVVNQTQYTPKGWVRVAD